MREGFDRSQKVGSYNFSIQVMLLYHYNIDCACIFERQEAKTSWSTRSAISHHSALKYFAKLRKVFFQRFWMVVLDLNITAYITQRLTISRLPIQSTNEHLSVNPGVLVIDP